MIYTGWTQGNVQNAYPLLSTTTGSSFVGMGAACCKNHALNSSAATAVAAGPDPAALSGRVAWLLQTTVGLKRCLENVMAPPTGWVRLQDAECLPNMMRGCAQWDCRNHTIR